MRQMSGLGGGIVSGRGIRAADTADLVAVAVVDDEVAARPLFRIDVAADQRDRRVIEEFVEGAETRRELCQLVVGQLLAAKAQDEMLGPGIEDLPERGVINWLGQVDAFDVGAETATIIGP